MVIIWDQGCLRVARRRASLSTSNSIFQGDFLFQMKRVLYWFTALLLISNLSLAACGGDSGSQSSSQESNTAPETTPISVSRGDSTAGKEKYGTICVACHGPGGEGVRGLGKELIANEFVAEKTDDELVEFIKVGRIAGDPLNTTGVSMPPKGGNPAFTDDDLYDIVAFIRTLQR